MADPFIAEVRIFAFNFAPQGWAFCNGQILPISQNTALFSLLGTLYGGNGRTTFALPNLQGCAPVQAGQGPGLSSYDLGQSGGSETVALISSEVPGHGHAVQVNTSPSTVQSPGANLVLGASQPLPAYQTNTSQNLTPMANVALAEAGGGQAHDNMQPYLTLNFCIALQGVFPPRS